MTLAGQAWLKTIAKMMVRARARQGMIWPLPQLCARATTELFPNRKGSERAITLLALQPRRFRHDLSVLAESGQVRVLAFPEYWHFAPLSWFDGEYIALGTDRQQFLSLFLSRYLPLVGAECLVSTSLWYRHDIPWGAAAESLGIPYLVFHKEGFKATEGQQSTTTQRAKAIGSFCGSHLVVQNETIRDVLLNAGFVQPSHISALGSLRMDRLIADERKLPVKRDLVTFFSFTHGVGLDELGYGQWPSNPYVGWVRLFEQTHAAFARFALANPSVECVIKTKWGHNWLGFIDQALAANQLDASSIPNLRITYEEDPHELMRRSKFVCGFNSTTLLEAGILGLRVVVPMFAEAADSRYAHALKLTREELQAFDVAHSLEEFLSTLTKSLKAPQVDMLSMRQRRELFERWVSKVDGLAAPKYFALLQRVCRRSHVADHVPSAVPVGASG
jgi:hypothetical protein